MVTPEFWQTADQAATGKVLGRAEPPGTLGRVEFSHEDRMVLRRAPGWLELHLPLEANTELDEIQPALSARGLVRSHSKLMPLNQ